MLFPSREKAAPSPKSGSRGFVAVTAFIGVKLSGLRSSVISSANANEPSPCLSGN